VLQTGEVNGTVDRSFPSFSLFPFFSSCEAIGLKGWGSSRPPPLFFVRRLSLSVTKNPLRCFFFSLSLFFRVISPHPGNAIALGPATILAVLYTYLASM